MSNNIPYQLTQFIVVRSQYHRINLSFCNSLFSDRSMKDISKTAAKPNTNTSSMTKLTKAMSTFELTSKQQQFQQYQQQLEQQQQQLIIQQQQLEQLTAEPAALRKNRSQSTWSFRFKSARLKNFLAKIHGSSKYQPRFPLKQIVFSYIGSFIGIAALAYISVSTHYPLIAAPFGAAAVLLFAAPDSPLAQPRNCIVGNFLGGLVSLIMVHLFGSEPWVMALAVATAIKVMQLTKTLHPPGGAVALVGVMSRAEWSFLFTPVLAGSIVLVFCTFVFNNLMPGRTYPKHWL